MKRTPVGIVASCPGFFAKVAFFFAAALALTGAMLFLPAGTLDYWQAWMFLAVLFIPVTLLCAYFLKNNPRFWSAG